jgi:hypothetical protein
MKCCTAMKKEKEQKHHAGIDQMRIDSERNKCKDIDYFGFNLFSQKPIQQKQ